MNVWFFMMFMMFLDLGLEPGLKLAWFGTAAVAVFPGASTGSVGRFLFPAQCAASPVFKDC